METITDRSFIDDTIDVDGRTFVRRTFERCILKFHGGEVFSTINLARAVPLRSLIMPTL